MSTDWEAALERAKTPAALQAARDYLDSARWLEGETAILQARLEAARRRGAQVASCMRDGEGAAGIANETAALECAILDGYRAQTARQRQLHAIIARVPDARQRQVLTLRYLEGLPFFRIAMRLHYDERQVYRYHQRGVAYVAAVMAAAEIGAPEAGEGAPCGE